MKIDLHTHTCHSFDCQTGVEDLIRAAEEAGLDAVAITDHDNMSAYGLAGDIARRVTVIPGIEITTRTGTHLIGLFLEDEIVSRDIFNVLDEIHEQGGLVMVPHPFRQPGGLLYGRDKSQVYSGQDISRILGSIDLIEIANFGCPNEEIIAAERYFESFSDLARGAGSDAHNAENVGRAYVELSNVRSRSLDNIKKALLEARRIIRYEAYTAEEFVRKGRITGKPRQKTLFSRTRELFTSPVRNSIRAIYDRSAAFIFGARKKSGVKNST
jgi:predicted metal-dependent phosphoesterase TrpH